MHHLLNWFILYLGDDNVQTSSQQLHTLSIGARLNIVG